MDDNRCARCQSKHQLEQCKLQRGKIKKTRFWIDCVDADAKEGKEQEFMSQFPSNVKSEEQPKATKSQPARPTTAQPTRAQPLPPVEPSPAQATHAQPPLPARPPTAQSTPAKQTRSTPSEPAPAGTKIEMTLSPSDENLTQGSNVQLTHESHPQQSYDGPNQTGFPDPVIHLPAVRREAPSFDKTIFNEKTQPIQQVSANANVSKSLPNEYIVSNSLRTQYGSGGQPVRVITNYVAVKKAPVELYEYTVSFDFNVDGGAQPESVPAKATKRRSELHRVFDSLKKRDPLQSRNDWATDYTYIWSVKKLFDGGELIVTDVGYFTQSGRLAYIPQVTFRETGELDLSRGHLDLIEAKDDNGGTGVAMKSRALNAIVSNFMCLSTSTPIAQFGANRFFITDAYEDMGSDCPFATVRGYFSSIRPGNDRILLNVNTTTSAFFKPMLVSRFIQIMKQCGTQPFAISGMLKKQAVRITYDRPTRPNARASLDSEESRRKVIAAVGLPPSQQKFSLNGKQTSVYDFFKDSTGCPLQKESPMPCMNVGADKPGKEQWIPAEFLEIDYPQPFSSILPSAFTDRMMKVALRGPAANANLIVNEGLVHLGIKGSANTTDKDSLKTLSIKEIGFDIDDKLIDIPARILKGPSLQYLVKGRSQPVMPMFASWNLVGRQRRKQPFAVPSRLPRIGILALGASRVNPQALARELRNTLTEHGVQAPNVEPWYKAVSPRPDQEGSYVRSMQAVIGEVEDDMRANGITVVLLPKQDFDIYSALKTVCDTRGLPTICSASPPQKLMNEQTLSNIALKFSLKTGGTPHKIEGGLKVVGTDTMIMGADVTHPASGAKAHCPSVAAAVGSFDDFAINYSGSMRLQKSRQEVILEDDMQSMAGELLKVYATRKKRLPSNIVYYRDGVSEGQYEAVRRNEVMAIEEAWVALQKQGMASNAQKVKITCLVVGKRHHTRFYPMNSRDADRSSNVKPGLVVDSVITHPYCFDFYLQSHAAVKGTARSAHYFLLRNDMRLNAQQLQDLTHALCYAYGPATKGISYCAPAYLADKLCERGRCYIRDWLLGRPNLSVVIQPYDKRSGFTIQQHERREARRLGRSRPYNIWETAKNGTFRGRLNPWHQSLDDKMFWV